MKRFTKICLLVGGILFLLGVLLMSVSWAMGFRGYYPHRNYDWELTDRNEQITEEVRNIKFEVNAGCIVVEEGDSFSIREATEGNHFKSRVEDGTWLIEENEEAEKGSSVGGFYVDNQGIYLKSDMGEVHVTVPRDGHLETVELEVNDGAVFVERISCDSMKIDVKAGNVEFSANVEQALEVECKAGGVSGILDGSEEDFNLETKCNVGSITAGSYEYGGFIVGSDRLDMDGEKKMRLACDVGSVDIDFREND